MYPVSDEYTALMNDESSILDVYVEVDFGDGAIVLGGSQIEYIDFNERVNDNSNILTFGCSCAHSVTIKLREPPELQYKGLKCKPRTGIMLSDGSIEWVPLGVFWVDSAKTNDDYRTVTITAYDKMYRLSGAYTTSLVYPALYADVVAEFETLTGCKVVLPTEFPALTIDNKVEDGKYSYRDIAGHLAGCLGRNATFNRDGELEFVFYTQTKVKAVESLQYLNGFEKLADNALKINFLVTGQDGEIELENDGTDPGKLLWPEDPADLPLLTFTYDAETLTASVELTDGCEDEAVEIDIPELVLYEDEVYTVTSVPDGAFRSSKMTSLTLPNTLQSIGDCSFYGCTNLTKLVVPASVTFVDNCAFAGCSSLEYVYWAADLSTVGYWRYPPFQNCSALSTVVIADGVTQIPTNFLRSHTTEVSVTIPDSVVTICGAAFAYATGLKTITIPDSVVTLGESAFEGCTNLVDFNFSTNTQLATLGDAAFKGCTAFEDFNIPSSVTYIGDQTFANCTGLLIVLIPSGVQTVENYAFSGCTSLQAVNWFADSPTKVGSHWYPVFNGCTALAHLNFQGANIPQYVLWGHSTEVNVIIGENVTKICNEAFGKCTGLTSISIPGTVQTIGVSAFNSCTNLQTVELGEGIATISDNAFQYCSSLDGITIPSTVARIGDCTFGSCGLTSIVIPATVTSVVNCAFADCDQLEIVYWNPPAISSTGSYTYPPFRGCPSLTTVVFGDDVTVIPANLLCKVEGLTSIVIPDQIKTIGGDAFNYCPNLASVQVGESIACAITSIGSNAFAQTDLLTDITIYALVDTVTGSPWGASNATITWLLA